MLVKDKSARRRGRATPTGDGAKMQKKSIENSLSDGEEVYSCRYVGWQISLDFFHRENYCPRVSY